MCPVCSSSVAWLITGGVSGLGATGGGIAILRYGKLAAGTSKIWKLRLASHFRQAWGLDGPKKLAMQERPKTGETYGQEQ